VGSRVLAALLGALPDRRAESNSCRRGLGESGKLFPLVSIPPRCLSLFNSEGVSRRGGRGGKRHRGNSHKIAVIAERYPSCFSDPEDGSGLSTNGRGRGEVGPRPTDAVARPKAAAGGKGPVVRPFPRRPPSVWCVVFFLVPQDWRQRGGGVSRRWVGLGLKWPKAIRFEGGGVSRRRRRRKPPVGAA